LNFQHQKDSVRLQQIQKIWKKLEIVSLYLIGS